MPFANLDRENGVRTRKPVPAQAQAFLWLIAALALGGFVAAAYHRPDFTPRSVQLFALLTLLTAFAYRYPVELAPKIKLLVVQVSIFAALLLLPLSMAAATTALGVAVGEALKRASLRQQIFNTSMVTLASLCAGAVLHLFTPHEFVTHPEFLTALVVAVAALVDYLVNALIVGAMVSLHTHSNAFAGWWERRRPMMPQTACLYLLAVFAALIGHVQPWTLLFVTVPALVVYRSLRDGVALRSQTTKAIEELADIVDMRDRYTFEHSRRVAELSKEIALRMGLGSDKSQVIFMAARVHDVGKIGIRSSTLFKATDMEKEEWTEMRSHPEVGARLISRFPDFSAGRDIVLHHHERFDGKGYPEGLAGEKIPLGARVVAVADTFDAMTSNRSYRQALPIEVVFSELERGRGTQFDPWALDVFLTILRERPDYVTRTESVTAVPRAAPPTVPGMTAAGG
jgi:HD-GYP domain-containing protein (c-di-GMP phosphodiesterase class II)